MTHSNYRRTAVLALLAALALPAFGQVSTNDLFDRANGTALGPDWMEIDGNAVIQGNQYQGSPLFPGLDLGWSLHTAFSNNYASTVVRASWSMNGGGGDSVSLVAGVDSSWVGIEAKVGDNNGDGLADRVWFHPAINAGTWYGGPLNFNLAMPIAAGTSTLWFTNNGDTANLEIRDANSASVEVFSASGILTNPPSGTGVGLAHRNDPTVDDFQAWVGSPTGPAYTFTTARSGSPASFLVTGATPLNNVALGFSAVGAGPFPTPLGTLGLTAPIEVPFFLGADINGRAELPTGVLPASLAGFILHTQAVDLFTPVLSNYFTITVL